MISENRYQIKNKFNTLTGAEARALHRSMSHTGRAPVRTASVLNKPRPPPLLVANLESVGDKCKQTSASKTSLSSSTYKAFQGPFSNLKRFIRANLSRQSSNAGDFIADKSFTSVDEMSNETLTNESFKSSVSHYSNGLDRSQTPPVCPPPPGELKSMSYMNKNNMSSNHQLDIYGKVQQQQSRISRAPKQAPPPPPPADFVLTDCQATALHNMQYSSSKFTLNSEYNGDDETDSWQLASLPVYYERNLSTPFGGGQKAQQQAQNMGANTTARANNNQRYSFMSTYQAQSYASSSSSSSAANEQAAKFDERPGQEPSVHRKQQQELYTNSNGSALTSSHGRSRAGSCQSFASIITTDSFVDFHRQQSNHSNNNSKNNPHQSSATPYRFSFVQPLSPPAPVNVPSQKNTGLPPRAPNSIHARTGSVLTDSSDSAGADSATTQSSANTNKNNQITTTKQISDNNSSSGNSSNCSSQLNVINNCDSRLSSLDHSSERFSDEMTRQHREHSRRQSATTGGNLSCLDNELDITLISETSTLQGDASGAMYYINKCAELERTVSALKDKLLAKEKELTDLQLNQLNYDFTIDKLRSQANKLEKENQQLKRRQLYAL